MPVQQEDTEVLNGAGPGRLPQCALSARAQSADSWLEPSASTSSEMSTASPGKLDKALHHLPGLGECGYSCNCGRPGCASCQGRTASAQLPCHSAAFLIDSGPAASGHARTQAAPAPGPKPTWMQRAKKQWETEFYNLGMIVTEGFKPSKTGKHWVFFTPVITISILTIFTFMAAQFPYYAAYTTSYKRCTGNSTAACFRSAFLTSHTGPDFFLDWWKPGEQNGTSFSFEFMNMWGAQYAPEIADGQWQRWFTSQFVHLNMLHVLGNVSIVIALGVPLERRFGWWRLLFVWVCSVLGGAFLSAAADDPCTQIIGASGGVFGLVGMIMADLVLNRHYLILPIYRLAMSIIFVGIFLGTVFLQPQVSHFSHLGGLLCGFLPTLVILPNKRRDALQRYLPWLGAFSILVWFVTLPTFVYLSTFPNMVCPM